MNAKNKARVKIANLNKEVVLLNLHNKLLVGLRRKADDELGDYKRNYKQNEKARHENVALNCYCNDLRFKLNLSIFLNVILTMGFLAALLTIKP